MKKLAIILGSRSDLPQLKQTIIELREQHVGTKLSKIVVHIMSIHRNPVEAWTFVFTDNCKGADAIVYCGSKAFAAPGALDAFIAAANLDIPVFGVVLGEHGTEPFEAARLSIRELPGEHVITDKNREPYVGADGLKAAVNRITTDNIPAAKERTPKPAEFDIVLE